MNVSRLLSKTSYRCAAGVLSGLLLAASFPKLHWHLLAWVACVPLLLALVSEPSLKRAFGVGYLTGAIFLAGSCYWFVEVMETYGKLSAVLAFGVLVLFVLVFSVFWGCFGFLEAWLARASIGLALIASPFLWVAMELARTYLITGFPWNLLGYAVQATGIRQAASVTGVYGLSFLAVATTALIAGIATADAKRKGAGAVFVWLLLLVLTDLAMQPRMFPPGTRQAFLLQPNVPLDESVIDDWEPWRNPSHLQELVSTSLAAVSNAQASPATSEGGAVPPQGRPLIVWAENPAPFFFMRDPVFRDAVETMARQAKAYVVVNTVNFVGSSSNQATNTAVVLDPEGRLVATYDKIHLVPFGEYVPDWAFPSKIGKITSEVGSYVPGTRYSVAATPEGTIGVFICYEAIFPQIVRRLAHAGAGVLVNISNDAWYGDSAAAAQHLEMARLRAIENNRYVLRATNDGVTCVIDPYGRSQAQLPRHRLMVLPARFDFRTTQTFYSAYGDVFAWLAVTVTLAMVIWRLKMKGTIHD